MTTDGRVYYWVDQYTDETAPCGSTLEEWAKWLAADDPDWGHKAAKPGDRFAVSVAQRIDAVATWVANDDGGEWTLDPNDVPYDWCAAAYGPGMGWDNESIGGTIGEALTDYDTDEPVDMALMRDMDSITVELCLTDGVPSLVEVVLA